MATMSQVRTRGISIPQAKAIAIAGTLVSVAGFIILMGIITAEALYPATYTTHDNEISDLGATRPPDSIILQPSARIFNATMLSSGLIILGAAAFLIRTAEKRRTPISLLFVGAGLVGVGVFPGNVDPYHGISALLTFVSSGVAAILSGTAARGPFKHFAIALGVVSLGSLVTAMLGDLTPVWDKLGDGGVERWVAYPVVVWLVALGAYFMGREANAPSSVTLERSS